MIDRRHHTAMLSGAIAADSLAVPNVKSRIVGPEARTGPRMLRLDCDSSHIDIFDSQFAIEWVAPLLAAVASCADLGTRDSDSDCASDDVSFTLGCRNVCDDAPCSDSFCWEYSSGVWLVVLASR